MSDGDKFQENAVDLLKEWIMQCDRLGTDEYTDSAQLFINMVVESITLEIPKISEGLSCYHNYIDDDPDAVYFDLQILKNRLILYLNKITTNGAVGSKHNHSCF